MIQRIKSIAKKTTCCFFLTNKIQQFRIKWKSAISGKKNIIGNKDILNNIKYDIVGDNNLIEIMQ